MARLISLDVNVRTNII